MLKNQFRVGASGNDQVLSFRTLAQANLRLHPQLNLHLELQDSRQGLADSGTNLTTAIVNSAELLEANIQWFVEKPKWGKSILRGGRLTIDIGKRRLVARNRFRNTKNSFTGVDWIWKAENGNILRTIFTIPVNRQPTSQPQLLQNNVLFDEETPDRILWGVVFCSPNILWGDKGEVYLFGLHEDDGSDFATRNRELYTPGFRLYRAKKKGRFDYEWESIIQFGTSRATSASTDILDLDHFAYFHHVEMGYSFRTVWSPRLIFAYDYASGDNDPDDETNERFDTLFGATVFDYGPTSIHRAFIRSNISGPGIKLLIRPQQEVTVYIHYREFWLASNKDVWAGNSGLRDQTGSSGSFLGQQWFLRSKWQALPNLQLEGGVVYRIDGDFQDSAPESSREGNSVYSYISTTFLF